MQKKYANICKYMPYRFTSIAYMCKNMQKIYMYMQHV